MNKPKKAAGNPSEIRSIRALAKLIGRSPTAACRWVSHPDWPFGRGPWSKSLLKKMRAWAVATLAPDFSSPPFVGSSVRKSKEPRPPSALDREIEQQLKALKHESGAV